MTFLRRRNPFPKNVNRLKLKRKELKTVSRKSKQKCAGVCMDGYNIKNAHHFIKDVLHVSYKLYNFGERGSGFKVSGEPQDYYTLKKECLAEKILFEDPQFPADTSSLFYSKKPTKDYEWKRPFEIIKAPKFVVDGYSRFDVIQGDLANCWLLSALATLTMYKNVFNYVVPQDQDFTGKYAGIFHFRFWQYGCWIDIVIDDRLPVVKGKKLRYMHSTEQNEFWSALLEKAYAKLHGSYEALHYGNIAEALTDFTGGISEQITLEKSNISSLYSLMLKAYERESLLGCSSKTNKISKEIISPQGIIRNHAYSITSVKCCNLQTKNGVKLMQLIRLRNPWGGRIEWNGPFSDKSSEWKRISEKTKKEIGLVIQADGEFWIPFEHFCDNFTEIQICNVRPDFLIHYDSFKGVKNKKWEVNMFHGEWVKGVTAGGCRNNNSFCHNPQYRITLLLPDEKEKFCTLIVFLIVKHKRAAKRLKKKNIAAGFSLYKV